MLIILHHKFCVTGVGRGTLEQLSTNESKGLKHTIGKNKYSYSSRNTEMNKCIFRNI